MSGALSSQIYEAPLPKDAAADSHIFETMVIHALDQLSEHNSLPLSSLVSELESADLDDAKLAPVLIALSREISRLDIPLATPLITALLEIRWSDRSPPVVELYVRFLGILASGIPRWWQEIADKVVAEFTLARSATRPHHGVIQRLLRYIPTSVSQFPKILGRHFPHKHDLLAPTENYVGNLLALTEYAPELQRSVWNLITERFMQMDLELDGDEEDEDDEDDGGDDDDEDFSDDSDDGGRQGFSGQAIEFSSGVALDAGEGGHDGESPRKRFRAADDILDGEETTAAELVSGEDLHELVYTKLDTLMVELLRYVNRQLAPEALEKGRGTDLFITLLEAFNEYVLPTHTTRSVQYIIFQAAHAHTEFIDAFLVSLIERALDRSVEGGRRQKSMQYVSSLVARAEGLSRAQIVHVVTFLGAWLDRYVLEREHEVDEAPTMARFRIFYATTQALMYIFCFRHALLRIPNSETQWEGSLNTLFQRLIVSKFNPLKYCKSTIVAMFARIARREDVAYCFSIMDQNRVGRFRSASHQSSPLTAKSAEQRLSQQIWPEFKTFTEIEGYFPFDPIPLRQTREVVERFYVSWAAVNDDPDSDSASHGDTSEEDEDESDGEDEGSTDRSDLETPSDDEDGEGL